MKYLVPVFALAVVFFSGMRAAEAPAAEDLSFFEDKVRPLLEQRCFQCHTPFAQSGAGRDHNGGTFVTWLAGAGVKPGVAHGRSDDLGYQAVEGKTYCYDLHATILHLLGIDHTQLSFRQAGIDRRLTDVHGAVVHNILS